MKKFLFLFLFLTQLTGQVYSQSDDAWQALIGNPQDYDSICTAYQSYILTEYPDSIPKSAFSSLKRFHRYNFLWGSRLGNDENNEASFEPYNAAVYENMLKPICEDNDYGQWELLGPSSYSTHNLGLVDEVLYDTSNHDRIIISCDRGGIWVRENTDGSWGWKNVTDPLRLPGLCASEIIRDPFDHNHLLASTASGILNSGDYGIGIIESFDNGDTWTVMEGFPYESAPFVQRIIADPNDDNPNDSLTLYAVSGTSIYKSTNSGFDWEQLTGLPTFSYLTSIIDIEIDYLGAIYIGTYQKDCLARFYKFDGTQWIDLNQSNFFNLIKRIRIAKPHNDSIFILCDHFIEGSLSRSIYKSTNLGSSWVLLSRTTDNGYNFEGASPQCEIEYSPGTNLIYLGEIKFRVIENTPPYAQAQEQALHHDIRDFSFVGLSHPYEQVFAATDGGLMLVSVNTGNITNIDMEDYNGDHLPIGDFTGIGVGSGDGAIIMGGAVHGGTWTYDNGWDNELDGDGGDCEINPSDASIFYKQTNHNMWNQDEKIYSNTKDWFIGMRFEFHPDNKDYIFFGRAINDTCVICKSHLMRWQESTKTLTQIPVSDELLRLGPIAIANDSLFYVADFTPRLGDKPDRIMKTTDSGANWIDLSQNTVYFFDNGAWDSIGSLAQTIHYKSISDIVLNPSNSNELWISITGVWTDVNGEPDNGKFRVLHSIDGGSTWYDYSEGLPAFPVEALEYQTGTNDRLFVGTDVGVFYRDASMNHWDCFSNGLPVSIITDLDYDACSQTLYASTYGRAIFKSSIPLDVSIGIDTLEYNTVTTWDQPRNLQKSIFIPCGSKLKVRANLYMNRGTKIIVDRGAVLDIRNCEITNFCGSNWKGIEVWGYTNQSQTVDSIQGKLNLENATISNAEIAVATGRRVNDKFTKGYEGGVIQAKNTIFLNNTVSLWYLPYRNIHPILGLEANNRGSFEKCTFNYLIDDIHLDKHVYLSGVKGLYFRGCGFYNYSDAPLNDHGTGIYSVASSFEVTRACAGTAFPCTEYTYSVFRKLKYGIKAYGISKDKSCAIKMVDFDYNKTGIYLSAIDNAEVTRNDFVLVKSDTIYDPLHCGLYLDNCSGYQIDENTFYSTYNTTNMYTPIGIVVNNSGGDNNQIYNNSCSRLYTGILAQNVNRNTLEYTGLELKCNDFDICEYDIAVTADTLLSNLGIRQQQGSNEEEITAPANNIFSYTHNNSESDYYNECEDITYWYAYNDGGFDLEPLNFSNPEVNPQTNDGYTTAFIDSIGCKTSFPPGGNPWWTVDTNTHILYAAESKIDSIQNLLDLLVDGGDTKGLNQEVETSFPDDAVELHGELISNSPYLSDSVMVSSIEQENVLSDAMVTEILMANPQSAKSDTVQQALDDRTSQLSEEQREDIDQGWFETGAKESLETLLSYYKGIHRKALNNIIRVYLIDSICPKPSDSLVALLQSQASTDMKYLMAFIYASVFDFTNANNVLNSIPQEFELSAGEAAQHQQYVSYFGLIENCYNQGSSILEADSTQIASLNYIYNNSSGSLRAMMRNILIDIDGLQYEEQYILPGEGMKNGKVRRIPVRKQYEQNSFKLYPNPAGEYVIVEYTMAGITPNGYVTIYDNKGTIVKTHSLGKNHDYNVIQVNDLSSGIYYCNFVVNGKLVQSEKLIILN